MDNHSPGRFAWLAQGQAARDRQNDGTTPEEYIRSKRVALGQEVLKKRRIYLDQKYWIYCRDAMKGNPQRPIHSDIFGVLLELVNSGSFLCPVSEPVLQETFKHDDLQTRIATAYVVDELSQGVAFQPRTQVLYHEVIDFVASCGIDCANHCPAEQAVWTRPWCVLGEMVVDDPAITKAVSDMLDGGGFSSFIRATSHAGVDFPFSFQLRAIRGKNLPDWELEWLNELSCFREESLRRVKVSAKPTFEELFQVEAKALVANYVPRLQDILTGVSSPYSPVQNLPKEDETAEDLGLSLGEKILAALKCNTLGVRLPQIGIIAGIAAAKQYGGGTISTPNDVQDVFHATLALPYCQLFLTENSLAHLLTTRPLQYDKLYGCCVLRGEKNILETLKNLLDEL